MSARDKNPNHEEFKPIDDVTCERILALGKFINDCIGDSFSYITRDQTGMPVEIKGQLVHSYWRKYESALKHIEISIKCDKCNARPLESSIRWENYDICLPCAAKFRRNVLAHKQDSDAKAVVRKELKNYAALTEAPLTKENTDVVQLMRVIFGMTRNMLPDAFWTFSDTELHPQAELPIEDQFNSFIGRMSHIFVYEFGRNHLARCFDVDVLNDPIYGPEFQAELDAKLNEKREEKVAEVDAQRQAMAQAANSVIETQDWGKPNPAWDECQ